MSDSSLPNPDSMVPNRLSDQGHKAQDPDPRSEPQPESWTYEETIAEIEAIITRIELGELELAEVFEQFEIAMQRLQQCEVFLNHHQQRMDLLIETLTDNVEGF
jgi:exodeoxyribonuclease VII small subunit